MTGLFPTASPLLPSVTSRRSRVPTVAASVVAVALALTLSGCSGTAVSGANSADTGFVSGDGSLTVLPVSQRKAAPAVVGETLDGTTLDLADFRGQVVVLNVWGSWCGPCRKEAPILEELQDELAPEGVQLVGLNTRDRPEPARAFVQRFGISFPSIQDPIGELQLGFRDTLPPAAIPSTLVLDREGRVAARVIGPLESSTTLAQLARDVVEEKSN